MSTSTVYQLAPPCGSLKSTTSVQLLAAEGCCATETLPRASVTFRTTVHPCAGSAPTSGPYGCENSPPGQTGHHSSPSTVVG